MEISRNPTVGYVAPFLTYIAVMAVEHVLSPSQIYYPLRCLLTLAVILAVSRPYITLKPSYPLATLGIGVAVFLIWIAPDALFHYRHFWLFENSLTGKASSSIDPALKNNAAFLVIRVLGSATIVPIIEELFWRGWLMRWLMAQPFDKVPLGAYRASAFWIVAVLFALEHGPYWEVGLAAGAIYNWWLVRTKNLADCIWAHAITNLVLGVFVIWAGAWQYWL